MKSAKLWVLVLLMASTSGILLARGDVDKVPSSQPLNQMPTTIGSWSSVDIPIDPAQLAILGNGDFLNRVYMPSDSQALAMGRVDDPNQIGLFIGYFPTQRTGQSIHSPQNCLPGAGWTFEKSGLTTLTDAQGKAAQVGEYTISNGTTKLEVLYWYQSHGRAIANDYVAKLYMLTDSIRYARTDAALVRVITPILPNESGTEAHERAVAFAEKMEPLLPAFIPN